MYSSECRLITENSRDKGKHQEHGVGRSILKKKKEINTQIETKVIDVSEKENETSAAQQGDKLKRNI